MFIVLGIIVWVLMVGFLTSLAFGAFSYFFNKFRRGVLISDEDGPGMKEVLSGINQGKDLSEILEMEHKALYLYPQYKNIILSVAEEKKNPKIWTTLEERFKKIRKWWLASFALYYGLTALIFLFAIKEAGFQNLIVLGRSLGMFLGNCIGAAIVYHCAYRKNGINLLRIILFFLPLYIIGIYCVVVGVPQPGADLALNFEDMKNTFLHVVLPLLAVFSPVFFYWIASFFLYKINRTMAKHSKVEDVKNLLQLNEASF